MKTVLANTYKYSLLPSASPEVIKGASLRSLKQLRYLPEGNNRLRLWLIPFSFSI